MFVGKVEALNKPNPQLQIPFLDDVGHIPFSFMIVLHVVQPLNILDLIFVH